MATTHQNIAHQIELAATLTIPQSRRELLVGLIDYLKQKQETGESIRLNFICTHNSRRSVLGQVWAQTLAVHCGLEEFLTFSGGTESTAVFPMIIKTLEKQGFGVKKQAVLENPEYKIDFSTDSLPIIAFSKKFDHIANPVENFAAIMVCDHANETCPYIPGAEQRIPLTYDDPKAFDGMPNQEAKYLERSLQIASEMYYVFTQLKK